MKKILAVAALAIVAIGGHVVANPLMSANSLKAAIENGDGAALAAKIDFDALRADLREDIDVIAATESDPMSRQMAKAFLGGMVDNIVTEDAVSSWGNGFSMIPADFGMSGTAGMGTTKKPTVEDYSFSFGLTRFTLNIETPNGPVGVVMAPRGLTWKVVGLDIDPEALQKVTGV